MALAASQPSGKVRALPIEPAQLASSLGALGSVDVERGLAVTLPQVLRSAKALLHADRVVLMLVDRAGTLRWASASDRVGEAVTGDLRVPVEVAGSPVGTLDVSCTASREWDDSAWAALQAYAGLVASLLVASVTAQVTGELADQLQTALAHQSLIEPDRLAHAEPQRRDAFDLEIALHRRDSELHEGEARRYERRGQAGRAQTERLQAAAARGRIIDAEAERRRADHAP
jgi:hypothetical protein